MRLGFMQLAKLYLKSKLYYSLCFGFILVCAGKLKLEPSLEPLIQASLLLKAALSKDTKIWSLMMHWFACQSNAMKPYGVELT